MMTSRLRSTLVGTFLALGLVAGCATAQTGSGAAPAHAQSGMLVGSNGMTLYTFDKDAPGKSNCNGQCASNWPPLLATQGDKGSGDWTVVERDDGRKQWAYKGKPVYFWMKDQKPGDTTGEGMNNVWHVARP